MGVTCLQDKLVVNCPICDREMEHNSKTDYYFCLFCETEVWPNDRKLKAIAQQRKSLQQARWAVGCSSHKEVKSLVPEVKKGAGGSRSSGGRKKKKKSIRPYEQE